MLFGKMRGQGSSEYLILLAVALMVIALVSVFVFFWPNFIQSVEKQRSDDYWQSARPFSVKYHAIYSNGRALIELFNTEPVTLVVTGFWFDGRQNSSFYNHSLPFSWSSEDDRCAAGDCAMEIRPGQTQIISAPLPTLTVQSCYSGGSFSTEIDYGVLFAITYHAVENAILFNETGVVPLVGYCNTV